MYGQPSAKELLEAISLYLEKTALPALTGRAAFHGRVAVNALAIAQREAELGEAAREAETTRLRALMQSNADRNTLNRALCTAIESGAVGLETPNLMAHLRASTLDRLAIEQPNYTSYKAAVAGKPLPW